MDMVMVMSSMKTITSPNLASLQLFLSTLKTRQLSTQLRLHYFVRRHVDVIQQRIAMKWQKTDKKDI